MRSSSSTAGGVARASGVAMKPRETRRWSPGGEATMRIGTVVLAVMLTLGAGATAWAQVVPGATVEERAVNGAKAYLQKHNLKNVEQSILLSSLYRNSFPDFSERWEKLTGVRIKIVPLGYTDIPA